MLASSPSRPQFLAAATTTHAGSFRRAPAPRNTPASSARSAPPSPPARFSALGLYRPLATPSPWLGFRAGLRRRVSGGPRCTPWEFPIHHGRRRQGLLHGDMKDATDLQLLKVPKALDRTQLKAKEVRLSDMPPITLDDTDVQT